MVHFITRRGQHSTNKQVQRLCIMQSMQSQHLFQWFLPQYELIITVNASLIIMAAQCRQFRVCYSSGHNHLHVFELREETWRKPTQKTPDRKFTLRPILLWAIDVSFIIRRSHGECNCWEVRYMFESSAKPFPSTTDGNIPQLTSYHILPSHPILNFAGNCSDRDYFSFSVVLFRLIDWLPACRNPAIDYQCRRPQVSFPVEEKNPCLARVSSHI